MQALKSVLQGAASRVCNAITPKRALSDKSQAITAQQSVKQKRLATAPEATQCEMCVIGDPAKKLQVGA